jgi:hypothetical protein
MASSARPVSACSKIWARLSRRADTVPRLVRARSCARSSSARLTIYCFAMAPSCFCRSIQEQSLNIKIAVVDH